MSPVYNNNNNNGNNANGFGWLQSFGTSSSTTTFGNQGATTPTSLAPSPWNTTSATATFESSRDDENMTPASSFGWKRNHHHHHHHHNNNKSKKSPGGATASASASSKKSSTHTSKWDDAQTSALAGLLRNADVLLGPKKKCSISKLLIKGTSGYRKLLDMYRPMFKEQRHHDSSFEQTRLIQTIIDAVWAQEGRFLTFDESTGVVAMVPNDDVMKQVRKDLMVTAPSGSSSSSLMKKNHQKKKKNHKSSEARKKKLHQQKGVSAALTKKTNMTGSPKKSIKTTATSNTTKQNKNKKKASRRNAMSA
eukprot:CAMPEP_0117017830 /NCGR_PEP_ID=MMETSP0472-20121206/13870_1 /TAXON_ID=693140 ORGANISM="Tiarina fusus, Strain LIS" /NCGR_SAMPLE_ID=MMETSP0472 /ASSEMBLY_ACC=CAM_ASM_000603 /LENGTH=306 /DNA_ID=CAMNT_0004722311 /DNA_START=199 /DNA_END=1119 /DNA_ORIENTATION=-